MFSVQCQYSNTKDTVKLSADFSKYICIITSHRHGFEKNIDIWRQFFLHLFLSLQSVQIISQYYTSRE